MLPNTVQSFTAALAVSLSLVSAASTHSGALDTLSATPPGVKLHAPKPTHPRSSAKYHQRACHAQRIHGVPSKTNLKSVAAILGAHQRSTGADAGYQNITVVNAYGAQYTTDVLFNGYPMQLLIDTGSADTWAIRPDFQCIDYANQSLSQSSCMFGAPYPNDFQYGEVNPTQHMYLRYGDGEIIAGPMGYSDVTLGNITVTKQQICLANTTYWYGNNVTSGLIGLAYPSLTNSYLGTGLSHNGGDRIEYSPLFTSMVSQGKAQPFFSIAIDRNSSSGLLAWGGVAPAVGMDTTRTASLDMIITNLMDRPETAYEYSFYTIIPDGWKYDQVTNTKKFPYIVDSGTTLCYLPPSLAVAINQAFHPPAVYLWSYGSYFTECDAIAPKISIILNGTLFTFNPKDLIYHDWQDPETSLCMTAIGNGGDGPYILGNVFMQNAVVVYDIGEAQMRFIPRPYY